MNDTSKEELILEAAMDEFIARGWSGARMQSIADRAGINKTLLHYYYRSKENLYIKIVSLTMESFFGSVLKNISRTKDFKDFLKTFINTLVDVSSDNPRIPMFIMQELSRGGEAVLSILNDVLGKHNPPVTAVMLENINRAMAEGKIRKTSPIQLIMTMLGSCLYFSMAEPVVMKIGAMNGLMDGFDRKAFLEERKKEIFNTLYRGLENREGEQ
ncbi:TetR/AcrR family transcriptional regulator [Spirochaeta isovalerica]|uniref:TetR/AcrR family transcriptional regulator n=1 Tax=Spirochaeta isovalerica TaxID=150 RepID=A0A841R6B4_9SPIO|nr:TetR/AcrR family transcriptional regulator [Spirochaeta isovalerica]